MAKVEIKSGEFFISAEGEESWLSEVLEKFKNKIGKFASLTTSNESLSDDH